MKYDGDEAGAVMDDKEKIENAERRLGVVVCKICGSDTPMLLVKDHPNNEWECQDCEANAFEMTDDTIEFCKSEPRPIRCPSSQDICDSDEDSILVCVQLIMGDQVITTTCVGTVHHWNTATNDAYIPREVIVSRYYSGTCGHVWKHKAWEEGPSTYQNRMLVEHSSLPPECFTRELDDEGEEYYLAVPITERI